jgi:hypothetical protein
VKYKQKYQWQGGIKPLCYYFRHFRAIEIETASSVEIGKSHTSIMENTVSKYSIFDFYELVKTFDKEFSGCEILLYFCTHFERCLRSVY